jgi:hypothetical protein
MNEKERRRNTDESDKAKHSGREASGDDMDLEETSDEDSTV